MDAIISVLFEALAVGGGEDLLSLSRVIRTARSSYRRQNPLYPHSLSRKEPQVGRRGQLAPLLLVQFHTLGFFFFNINKLVTFGRQGF